MKKYNRIEKIIGAVAIFIIYVIAQFSVIKYIDIAAYHKLMISLPLITVCICSEIIITFADDNRLFDGNIEFYKKVEFYWLKKQSWLITHWIWLTLYYFISAMSVLSSCIIIYITSKTDDNITGIVILYSIIALGFTFINLIVKPFDGSKAYRYAYIRMEKYILKCKDGSVSVEELVDEFEKCENEITNGIILINFEG